MKHKEGKMASKLCEKCDAVAEELHGGLCDLCMERAWWDYQESAVF